MQHQAAIPRSAFRSRLTLPTTWNACAAHRKHPQKRRHLGGKGEEDHKDYSKDHKKDHKGERERGGRERERERLAIPYDSEIVGAWLSCTYRSVSLALHMKDYDP